MDRILSVLSERDILAASLTNANKRLSEVERELHYTKVEKWTLEATADLQVLDIISLKIVKDSLKIWLADQDADWETYWKRGKAVLYSLGFFFRMFEWPVEV